MIFLGRYFNVDVKLHWSLPVFFLALYSPYFYTLDWDVISVAFLSFVMVFLSVILHEFGHIFAARRYGCEPKGIVLWPLGGVAVFDELTLTPKQDLVVSAAGPAVSALLAAVSILAAYAFLGQTAFQSESIIVNYGLVQFGLINLALTVFNLIPAYPMDGGRIFVALMRMITSERIAVVSTALLAQIMAIGMGLLGFYLMDVIIILVAVAVFFLGPRMNGVSPIWFIRMFRSKRTREIGRETAESKV